MPTGTYRTPSYTNTAPPFPGLQVVPPPDPTIAALHAIAAALRDVAAALRERDGPIPPFSPDKTR